jgi:hypothetical protein
MSIPPDFTRRVQENPQIAVELYEALDCVMANLPEPECAIWRAVHSKASAALASAGNPDFSRPHAHYAHELALDAAARTGEEPLPEHVRCIPGMEK